MSKNIEILITQGAIAILERPRAWSRGTMARTANGRPCGPNQRPAQRFCAYGALVRAAFELCGDITVSAKLASNCERQILRCAGLTGRLSQLNDRMGRGKVLEIMRRSLNLT